jgi:hypothetical protein
MNQARNAINQQTEAVKKFFNVFSQQSVQNSMYTAAESSLLIHDKMNVAKNVSEEEERRRWDEIFVQNATESMLIVCYLLKCISNVVCCDNSEDTLKDFSQVPRNESDVCVCTC